MLVQKKGTSLYESQKFTGLTLGERNSIHNLKNTNSEFLIHINYLMVLLSYYNTEPYNQIYLY